MTFAKTRSITAHGESLSQYLVRDLADDAAVVIGPIEDRPLSNRSFSVGRRTQSDFKIERFSGWWNSILKTRRETLCAFELLGIRFVICEHRNDFNHECQIERGKQNGRI